jgi:hypothetical protein
MAVIGIGRLFLYVGHEEIHACMPAIRDWSLCGFHVGAVEKGFA